MQNGIDESTKIKKKSENCFGIQFRSAKLDRKPKTKKYENQKIQLSDRHLGWDSAVLGVARGLYLYPLVIFPLSSVILAPKSLPDPLTIVQLILLMSY